MKARIFWVVTALALAGLIGLKVVEARKARAVPFERPREEALITTARAVRADLDEKVAFTGAIRPNNEVDVFAKVPGRIESLPVQLGDLVKAGQPLAVIEHKEIAWQTRAAEASVGVARAALDGARQDHDRTLTLLAGGSATRAMADGAKVRLALSEAQLAQAEAAAGLARQSLANATVVAPITGVIARRPVNLGAMAGPMLPIATIQDVSTLKLEGSLEAPAFLRLRKGARARVTVDALPGEVFPATVSLLAPALDPIARRAAVEIALDPAPGLLPNMFARVEVVVGRLEATVAVPMAAVHDAGGGGVVFRVADGRARLVRPRLGTTDRGLTAVLEGLDDGDEVAVTGQAGLTDGTPVRTASPKASKPD